MWPKYKNKQRKNIRTKECMSLEIEIESDIGKQREINKERTSQQKYGGCVSLKKEI